MFHSDVQEVLLHATVIDDKQHMITNLDKNAFTVFEDGKLQVIKSFRHEDIPISLGIVIDNSGSMREKRAKVNKAALNLVRASNPQDEVFVVNFSDEFFLDQPFTNKINLLQSALEKYETRGGTALYDAVVASADELKRHGKLQKKILFVVTDGEDDASRESLEQAVRHAAGREWPHGVRHRPVGRRKTATCQARPANYFRAHRRHRIFSPHAGRSGLDQQRGGP